MLIGPFVPLPHYGAESSRGGIEDIDLILFHYVPESVRVGVGGDSFKHHSGSAKGQWPIDNIAVASDPAYIGGAPEGILFPNIKCPLEGLVAIQKVAGMGMEHSLRFTGTAAGIKDKQWVFGIHHLRLTVGLDILGHHLIMPPAVTAGLHSNTDIGPLDHNHLLHVRAFLKGDIRVVLTPDNPATAVVTIGTD
ncbi:hypothetical protein ES705_35879 [subsurface metagenome]